MPDAFAGIIDTHCHLGASKLSSLTITESGRCESMHANGITMAFVMPHAVHDDWRSAHDTVLELTKRNNSIRGIVNASPVMEEEEYNTVCDRYITDCGFVAIKLNPHQHLTSPTMDNARKVFQAASRLKVPLIVHTGTGIPWALPSLCISPARRYPDVPVILAHAGFSVFTDEAVVAAEVCENIFIEASWCSLFDVEKLVKSVGTKRMMFGSDLPANAAMEIHKYRLCKLSDSQLDDIFRETALRIFRP